jgi:DNA-binding transcriptional LysR family regulator
MGYVIELNHLKYFFAVAKAGSFTVGAKNLRVSQPAVSKTIGQIEGQIDGKLFDRRRGAQLHLTPLGSRLYAHCERIFDEVDAFKESLKSESDICKGTIAIGASDNICNYLLPKLISDFRNLHPETRFEIFCGTSEEIKKEIQESKVDLGLFHSKVEGSKFDSQALGEALFRAVCRRNQKSIQNYLVMGLIAPRVKDYSKPVPIVTMLQKAGLRPSIAAEANNQETQKRLALQGEGFAVLPAYMIQAEIRTNLLREIPLEAELRHAVYLVKRSRRTLSQAANMFGTFLIERMPKVLG